MSQHRMRGSMTVGGLVRTSYVPRACMDPLHIPGPRHFVAWLAFNKKLGDKGCGGGRSEGWRWAEVKGSMSGKQAGARRQTASEKRSHPP